MASPMFNLNFLWFSASPRRIVLPRRTRLCLLRRCPWAQCGRRPRWPEGRRRTRPWRRRVGSSSVTWSRCWRDDFWENVDAVYNSVYIYNESLCSVYNHDATVIMVLFMNHFGIQCIYIDYDIVQSCPVKSLMQCFRTCHRFHRSYPRSLEVVHVSRKLSAFHRSYCLFTSPLITFVFNCCGMEGSRWKLLTIRYRHTYVFI